jgi:hypothetical protein
MAGRGRGGRMTGMRLAYWMLVAIFAAPVPSVYAFFPH